MLRSDKIIQNPDYMKIREAEGMTKDEIRKFWNQGLFLRRLDIAIRNQLIMLNIEIKILEGEDIITATRNHYKTAPKYGCPNSWDSSLPINEGLTHKDADLPEELVERIHKWETSVGETHRVVASVIHLTPSRITLR